MHLCLWWSSYPGIGGDLSGNEASGSLDSKTEVYFAVDVMRGYVICRRLVEREMIRVGEGVFSMSAVLMVAFGTGVPVEDGLEMLYVWTVVSPWSVVLTGRIVLETGTVRFVRTCEALGQSLVTVAQQIVVEI